MTTVPRLVLVLIHVLLATTPAPGAPAPSAPGKALPEPAFANVRYGPHARNVFDLWLPGTKSPAPLVLFIHGGGFWTGDKNMISPESLREYLAAGWAAASLNYRFTDAAPAPAAYLDCARALQHLRHHAKQWNIDSRRVASTGTSAGAGTSLWLAFHDDLADSKSSDPIARESTRVTCVAVLNGQPSYDPRFAEKAGLPRPNFERNQFFLLFYAITEKEIDTPKAYARYEEAAPVTYLGKGDPPVLMAYTRPNEPVTPKTPVTVVVHHPLLGLALKREMDRLGIECIVQFKDARSDQTVQEPRVPGQPPISTTDFIRRHFQAAGQGDPRGKK